MGFVRFTDVGRGKKSWDADIPFHESSIAIEAGKACASRGVDAFLDDGSTTKGGIYVGGFRRVGSFEIVAEGEAP